MLSSKKYVRISGQQQHWHTLKIVVAVSNMLETAVSGRLSPDFVILKRTTKKPPEKVQREKTRHETVSEVRLTVNFIVQ